MEYDLEGEKAYNAAEDWKEFCNFLISNKILEKSAKYIVEDNEVHNKYDKGYKYLLSIKKNFIDFMKTFMKITWSEEIEEKDITLMDKEFITGNFDKKESDLIYEIKLKNEKAYFILIEIQSSVDRKMAYRLLNYMVEIWRKWEANSVREEKFVLPKIIPCVLYSGKKKWTAPIEFKELYDEVDKEKDYLINFKYILIDVHRYKPEHLLEVGNIISSAFYLETSTKEDMENRLENLTKSLAQADKKDVEEFKIWAVNMFRVDKQIQNIIEEKFAKEDVEMNNLARIGRELYEDGKQNAKVSSIKHILTKKLNEVPSEEVVSKLEKMQIKELEEIEDRILEIESWEEI